MDLESDSSDSSAVSTTSVSSSSSDGLQRPKRYKLKLEPNFKSTDVSISTRRRWESKLSNSSMSSSHQNKNSSKNVNILHEDKSSSDNNLDNISQMEYRTEYSENLISENADEVPNDDKCFNQETIGLCNGMYIEKNVESDNSDQNSDSDEEDFECYSVINNDDSDSEMSDSSCSSDDDDNEPLLKSEELFERTMFNESKLKVRDVITMITALSLDLKFTDQGKIKFGEFVKLLAGDKFKNVNLSKYMMDKCCRSQKEYISCHFYCSKCNILVYTVKASEKKKSKQIFCEKCKEKYIINKSSPNYFSSVDLKYQLEKLLHNETLLNDILSNVNSRNIETENIEDVNAGSIHKSIMRDSTNAHEIILTVNMNVDGAPLTKSGKRGFWPVQVILNDLSPKLRPKYILLCGLLLTEKEPKSNLLNLYLDEVYVKQMNLLYSEGIEISHNGVDIVFKFCTHSVPVDSVCRPIIQNRVQFNGYMGCSWCYQLGLYIPELRGIRYPVNQDDTERTNLSHQKNVEKAKCDGVVCNGVRGESCLSKLPHFDMVWSFPFEHLHGLIYGPTLQSLNEWKTGGSKYKLTKAQVDFIEKRFLNITPTNEIHRLPRSGIIAGSAKPKASELKSWLLYYSLPCLKDMLDDEALKHYSLLVKVAFTALKPKQTENELNQCEIDCVDYVVGYHEKYGGENMTFNVHTVTHIVPSIRKTGSLCYNSAFPAESNIYTLKTYVTGPNAMDIQIAKKHLQCLLFRTNSVDDMSTSEIAISFCCNLFNPVRLTKSFHSGPDITYCGKGQRKAIPYLGMGMVYKKCIYKSTVYHGENYTRSKKTNNSVIQFSDGVYAKIIKIVEYDYKPYVMVKTFKIFEENPFEGVEHIKLIHSENTLEINKPMSEIKCKIILVNTRNGRYLCHMPNTFEVQ